MRPVPHAGHARMTVRRILQLLWSNGAGRRPGAAAPAGAGEGAVLPPPAESEARPAAGEWFSVITDHAPVTVIRITLPEVLDDADFDRVMKSMLERVAANPAGSWVLDLTPLDYAGSAMLGLMVNIRQTVRAAGGRLVLSGVSPRLLAILRTCSLERLFLIHRTLPDAVRAAR